MNWVPVVSAARKTLRTTAIVVGYGAALYLLAMAFDRKPPVEQLMQREELSGLKPGDSGDVLVRVKRNRLCPTDVDAVMYDGDGSRYTASGCWVICCRRGMSGSVTLLPIA